MRKTQFAAFLLSGLLVLNTAIPAFVFFCVLHKKILEYFFVCYTKKLLFRILEG